LEVKERLEHGEFQEWVEGNFSWAMRSATRMMEVAENFKSVNLSDLDFAPSALYALAAPSTPESAREEAIQKAESGGTVTHKDLDDATMLRIMANENLSDWAATPGVINETVFAAKEFLDEHLSEVEWDTSQEFLKGLFDSKKAFDTARGMGVGESVVKKFLGSNWSTHMIRESLAVYRSVQEDEDREAKREARRVKGCINILSGGNVRVEESP
jgi:hypothetical protein